MMSAASKINHRIVGNSVKKFALSSRLGNNVLKAHIRRPMVCMRFPLLTNCRASGDVEKIKSSFSVMENTMMELKYDLKYGLKATTSRIKTLESNSSSMTKTLAEHTKFLIELKSYMKMGGLAVAFICAAPLVTEFAKAVSTTIFP